MNFENNPNENQKNDKNQALGEMNFLHQIMMQRGRQDWEITPALLLIEQVKRDEITPDEGVARMQAILDSKQEH